VSLSVKEQREIRSRLVCQCGHPKQCGQSFCNDCYHQLPKATRRRLYLEPPCFGDVYLSALRQLEQLRIHEPGPRYHDPRRRALAARPSVV
jgi:hypothetical protein